MRGEAIEPFIGRNGLPRQRIGAECGPVAFGLVLLVGDGAFDDENERSQLPRGRLMEGLQKIVAVLAGEQRVSEVDFGNPRNAAEDEILEARLSRARQCNRLPIAAEPAVIQSTSISVMGTGRSFYFDLKNPQLVFFLCAASIA